MARDASGRRVPGVLIDAATFVRGVRADVGTLSNQRISTNWEGRAAVTYYAPPPPPADAPDDLTVTVVMTPVGTNFANASGRSVLIRLLRPGIVRLPNRAPGAAWLLHLLHPSAEPPFTKVKLVWCAMSAAGVGIAYLGFRKRFEREPSVLAGAFLALAFVGLESASSLNNDVPYGLSSAIYTADVNAAFRAMRDLYTGIVYVNAPTIGAEIHLPFGGTKGTGNGHREGGTQVLDVFSEWKSIYVDFSGGLQRAQIDNAE